MSEIMSEFQCRQKFQQEDNLSEFRSKLVANCESVSRPYDELSSPGMIASALVGIALHARAPEGTTAVLSSRARSQLMNSIIDLHPRIEGLSNETINGLTKKGWRLDSGPFPSEQQVWYTPKNQILCQNGSLFRTNSPFLSSWLQSRPVDFLDSKGLTLAAKSGALTKAESLLFARLSTENDELQRLGNIRMKISDTSSIGFKDLKPMENQTNSQFRGLQGLALLKEHNQALGVARDELMMNARRQAWGNIGLLAGSQFANLYLDKHVFDSPTTWRSGIVDATAPLVTLARLHWSLKAAYVVGSHAGIRCYERLLR